MALVGMSHPRQYDEQSQKVYALAQTVTRPDIISDLSIVKPSSGLKLWERIARETDFVAATLPIYTAKVKNGLVDSVELLELAIEQMEGGVGLITIHPTPSILINQLSKKRLVPCTSRGGGIVITDAENRKWVDENVYLKILPQLVYHARKNGTAISLGASYRSANIFDSYDAAQVAEIEFQIELAKKIKAEGVGVIIESPGHARPRDIKSIAQLLKPGGFPIMPLGPIPTDTAIGMDHVSSAIGATLLGLEGCAHVLAAVTREEHTGGIPTIESTVEAVATARVAAHVIDLHTLSDDAKDYEIAVARANHRTCVIEKSSHGCDRCSRACPL
jgi:phosphomethylpyrimidine synthase